MEQGQRKYVCQMCLAGNCNSCVDTLNVVFDIAYECNCDRPGHSGEPVDKQILDPFTGAVHAPGLVVEESGEVKRK